MSENGTAVLRVLNPTPCSVPNTARFENRQITTYTTRADEQSVLCKIFILTNHVPSDRKIALGTLSELQIDPCHRPGRIGGSFAMRTGVGEIAASSPLQHFEIRPVMDWLRGRIFVHHLFPAQDLSVGHPPLHVAGNRKIRRGGHRQGIPVGTDHSALPAYTAVRYAYAGSAAVRSAADPLRPDPDPGSDDYRVRPGQKQPEIPQTAPVGVGLRIKRKIGIAGHPLAKFSALQGRRVPDFRPENEKPHHRGVSGLLFRK